MSVAVRFPQAVRSSDGPETTERAAAGGFAVVAAGCVPWRRAGSHVEVLVIHRPRYDDWSWPKGKIDDGETVPECAVRELREETGIEGRLGIPLPAVTYPVSSGEKVVYYWAIDAAAGRVQPDGDEVDEARWVTVGEAARLLTNPNDRLPLDALAEAFGRGDLETLPFVVVRHAKAKPRSTWTKEEGQRPLAATGRRQALAVCRLLAAWHPERVATSPWTRCLQTFTPYAKRQRLNLKLVPAITEHAARRKPEKARRAFSKLLDKAVAGAVCTHRPVLPLALATLRERLPADAAAHLPAKDPYLRPGSMVVVHQPRSKRGTLVSVELYEPYQD